MPDKFTRENAIKVFSGNLSSEDIEKLLDIGSENITNTIESFFDLDDNTFRTNKVRA